MDIIKSYLNIRWFHLSARTRILVFLIYDVKMIIYMFQHILNQNSCRYCISIYHTQGIRLLCTFHILQAFWRWIHDSKHHINKLITIYIRHSSSPLTNILKHLMLTWIYICYIKVYIAKFELSPSCTS